MGKGGLASDIEACAVFPSPRILSEEVPAPVLEATLGSFSLFSFLFFLFVLSADCCPVL